ncbi:MAG: OmpH family outer membrane protein [Nitrospira sp.]|nr:OmpH family outer membrane protein [Nitrospira sp.]MDH4304092.1 OmpH family outer membrane protein [Nitrospira sp.]MDH5193154.1 OmpH family outer membrane protein [Nitrospira sp.]
MINRTNIIVLVVLWCTVQWVAPLFAGASAKVGVMDQQLIFERSKAGKAALEDMAGYAQTRQKIISSDEQELKELQQALEDPNAKLTDAVRQEKEEQLRGKVEAYQHRVQEFNREVQQKRGEMVAEYSRKIAAAAQAVAQKEGYAAILDKGNDSMLRIVLYHQAALDVTELVVKEFDRQNP